MKTMGLLGGMSWESTVPYYQIINRVVKERLGGLHSARCILYSVDFAELEANMSRGDWDANARILSDAARVLRDAGAEFLVVCTNTMHKLADQIESAAGIPLLHIADLTADVLEKQGIKSVGLLGTRFTMEQDFFKSRLEKRGIKTLVPDAAGCEGINEIIFSELCRGEILPESKRYFIRQIGKLREAGAEGMIFGCTEIGLFIPAADVACPVFDTTVIHATGAAEYALAGEKDV